MGGGNHFIELDYNEERGLMGATVHTGSRNIGQKVCSRWTQKAIATQGYLSGNLLSQYLTDMVVAQAYAQYNLKIILDKIADIYKKLCKGKVTETISSVHNYLDFSDMIIRKGAIRSYEGDRMVIPFNMRDGLAICEGKSNADWNCSALHGAERNAASIAVSASGIRFFSKNFGSGKSAFLLQLFFGKAKNGYIKYNRYTLGLPNHHQRNNFSGNNR